MERIYFHGNNKTNEELQMGVDYQVGTFVVDNFSEVLKINQLAKQKNIIQNILLRVNPSINVKTHDHIKTGHGDSKFGFNLFTNEIVDAINYLKELTIHVETGVIVEEVNLGGGFGIAYLEEEQPPAIEPGRSIVGEAGIMLYQVGYIKEKVTVVGKCCESGDVILNDVVLPKIQEGDLIVLRCTGAYGYSMVSNYNKIRKPAVVMVRDKEARLICKRQSYEQLIEDEL